MRLIALPLLAVVLLGQETPRGPKTYDLVVYGGTSAGVMCAVRAAELGRSVLVVNPDGHLGGMTASGLGATDIGNKRAIGGLSRGFYRAVRAHYTREESWRQERRQQFRGWRDEDAMWYFEPHVAKAILEFKLGVEEVTLISDKLDLDRGCHMAGARIVSFFTTSGRRVRGRMFVDATYEGDLMSRAGVSYHVGREPNHRYGETLNGVQTARSVKHQFRAAVDPYLIPGRPASGLLFGIQGQSPGADGSGDARVQAYNFRLCLTDAPDNRVPFKKPEGHDEGWYELLLRNLEAGDLRLPYHSVRMPNRKTDTNNNHAVSTDFIGMNWRWPEADHVEREALFQLHKRWQQGLFWTLANHPRVPIKIREEVSRWGLAKDEFTETGNWPPGLYVREGRRMISDYVMTERDCLGARRCKDSVGLAAYNMDSHNVQRWVDKADRVRNEGDIQVPPTGPYPISYKAIVPRRQECTNLLVPVCLSASHIAYGSNRMEPVLMILGESAAMAAPLALAGQPTVQDVPYAELRDLLLKSEQVLE